MSPVCAGVVAERVIFSVEVDNPVVSQLRRDSDSLTRLEHLASALAEEVDLALNDFILAKSVLVNDYTVIHRLILAVSAACNHKLIFVHCAEHRTVSWSEEAEVEDGPVL